MSNRADTQTSLIERVWARNVRQVAFNVVNDKRDHVALARVAEHIRHDYHGRFLIELLQNAADQSGGRAGRRALIVRAHDWIAVGNAGSPFTARGVEAITELALSTKDPLEAVGNKGIGFKSVYQVTDAPEVHSAAPARVGARPGDADATRFAMPSDPFADVDTARRLRALCEDDGGGPAWYPEIHRALSAEPQGRGELLYEELRRAPPYWFPIPICSAASVERIHRALPDDLASARMCTWVVLPVRDAKANAVVQTAMAALMSREPPVGSWIAFLPAIGRLDLVDLTAERRVTLRRTPTRVVAGPTDVELLSWRTSHEADGARTVCTWEGARHAWNDPPRAEGDPPGPIQAAAQQLPGAGWQGVTTAAVTVAFPRSTADGAAPLAPSGRFSVSLPTLCATGSPLWVDGRFHADISRTDVKLDDEPYNALLFARAATLAGTLARALQARESRVDRLRATWLLARADGPLGDALYAPGGLAREAVVLAHDGRRFVRGADLRPPNAELVEAMPGGWPRLLEATTDRLLIAAGIVLPAREVLIDGQPLLASLGVRPAADKADMQRPWLARAGGPSVLEQVAAHLNRSAHTELPQWLAWVVERFDADALRSQRVLPLHRRRLASADDRVFLAPAPPPKTTRGRGRRVVETLGSQSDEIANRDIPRPVRDQLHVLDSRIGAQRHEGSTAYTPFASALRAAGLVKSPRKQDMIVDGLAPRIAEAAGSGDEKLAGALLWQALVWTADLKPKARIDVGKAGVLVPTATGPPRRRAAPQPTKIGPRGGGPPVDPPRRGPAGGGGGPPTRPTSAAGGATPMSTTACAWRSVACNRDAPAAARRSSRSSVATSAARRR